MKTRRLFGIMILVCSLLAGMVAVTGPDMTAKKKKTTYTLLEGDSTSSISVPKNIRSISVSDKSVIEAELYSGGLSVTPLKAGTSKVILRKKKKGKLTYTFKVKPLRLTVTKQKVGDRFICTIKNETSFFFRRIDFFVHHLDASGNKLGSDPNGHSIDLLTPGGIAYFSADTSDKQRDANYNSGDIADIKLAWSSFNTGKASDAIASGAVSVETINKSNKEVEVVVTNNRPESRDPEWVFTELCYDQAGNIVYAYRSGREIMGQRSGGTVEKRTLSGPASFENIEFASIKVMVEAYIPTWRY